MIKGAAAVWARGVPRALAASMRWRWGRGSDALQACNNEEQQCRPAGSFAQSTRPFTGCGPGLLRPAFCR